MNLSWRKGAAAGLPRRGAAPAALLLAAAFGFPGIARGMAGDGALLTNMVTAVYFGISGPTVPYTVSYAATANVLISCPIVGIRKEPNTTVQNVGGTVTFEICTFNNSLLASAFNLTLRDRMPDNVVWAGNYSTYGAALAEELYSTDGVSYPPANDLSISPPALGTEPLWFLWELTLGPQASACIQYAVEVK